LLFQEGLSLAMRDRYDKLILKENFVPEIEAKRARQFEESAALKADIEKGLADIAAGRTKDFDAGNILYEGRTLLAKRAASAWPGLLKGCE